MNHILLILQISRSGSGSIGRSNCGPVLRSLLTLLPNVAFYGSPINRGGRSEQYRSTRLRIVRYWGQSCREHGRDGQTAINQRERPGSGQRRHGDCWHECSGASTNAAASVRNYSHSCEKHAARSLSNLGRRSSRALSTYVKRLVAVVPNMELFSAVGNYSADNRCSYVFARPPGSSRVFICRFPVKNAHCGLVEVFGQLPITNSAQLLN